MFNLFKTFQNFKYPKITEKNLFLYVSDPTYIYASWGFLTRVDAGGRLHPRSKSIYKVKIATLIILIEPRNYIALLEFDFFIALNQETE